MAVEEGGRSSCGYEGRRVVLAILYRDGHVHGGRVGMRMRVGQVREYGRQGADTEGGDVDGLRGTV